MSFTFELDNPGWAKAWISDGYDELEIFTIHIGDGLGELTWAIVGLMNGSLEQTCQWIDTPGEWRWIMDRHDDELTITILRFEHRGNLLAAEQGQQLFQSRCKLRQFAIQLNNQLWNLVREHGLDGYAKLWHNRFPEERWKMLGELISQSNS